MSPTLKIAYILKMKVAVILFIYISFTTVASVSADCSGGNVSCSQCYETLVQHVVKDDKSMFKLLQTFSPPNHHSPVFVVVTYEFENSTTQRIYFWTSYSSYFLQPLEVFRFTSLFLGSPAYLRSKVSIILPDECENADPEHLEMLTYLVC